MKATSVCDLGRNLEQHMVLHVSRAFSHCVGGVMYLRRGVRESAMAELSLDSRGGIGEELGRI
jgi:hypothetical protein